MAGSTFYFNMDLMSLDVNLLRKDFPILQREVRPGVPLVYLDSTATAQKPLAVINAMDDYYRRSNANIHRGVHTLAEEATTLYEQAREKIAQFIHAPAARQVVYTRNATESINLVAYTWARANLKAGDLVILTEMEHHSNLVPWHMLQAERGIRLEFIPVTENGLLDLEEYKRLLTQGARLVSFTHMSNVLGTINPAADMIRWAHEVGAVTLIDGASPGRASAGGAARPCAAAKRSRSTPCGATASRAARRSAASGRPRASSSARRCGVRR